jgi:YD repeat-containing protein
MSYTIEVSAPPSYTIDVIAGPIVGGSGAAVDVLSYGTSQQLTLAQLRTARRNLIQGSAPSIAYDGSGRVVTITYSDGSVKTFTYTLGLLTRIDHVYTSPARTYRKDFLYLGDGRLQSIVEAIL